MLTVNKINRGEILEYIDNENIIIDADGQFPRNVIFKDRSGQKMYRIVKTRDGKFALNK